MSSDPLDPLPGVATEAGADHASYAAVPPPAAASAPSDSSSSFPSAEEAYAMAFGGGAAAPAPAAAAAAPEPAGQYQAYQSSYGGGGGGYGGERTCDQCGLPGHIARFCPETMVCRKCGGAGHEQKNWQVETTDKLAIVLLDSCGVMAAH